jgi:hypothetical protein
MSATTWRGSSSWFGSPGSSRSRSRSPTRICWAEALRTGCTEPWDRVDGDVVRYEETVGGVTTDCLLVGEPPSRYLELFDTFARLMAARADEDSDWEWLQREFAQVRSRGDLATAADR